MSLYFLSMRRHFSGVLPGIIFTAVTILITYPVSLRPGSLVIGRPFEDAFESIWYLDWYGQAIFDRRVWPLFQPDIFFPFGWNLGFAVLPPLYPALLSPLTAAVGSVAAYNITIVATCIVAAYGSFLLARAIGADFAGATLAGIAYAFYPQRQVYLSGHLNFLLGSMWLPWLLLALVQARRDSARRNRWLLLAAVAWAMSVAGAWNFAIISTAVVLIFGLVYFGPLLRREWRAWIQPLSAATLAALALSGPFLLNAALVRERLGMHHSFSFATTNASSVSLERLFVPSALNPLVWDLARNRFPLANGQDGVVNFGYVVMILAAVAIMRWRPAQRRAFLAIMVAGLLLMLGPMLHFKGQAVSMNLPHSWLVEHIAPSLLLADGGIGVPMPALAAYLLLPPFRTFHHFGRWGLVVMLVAAPLAGWGLTYLLRRLYSPAGQVLLTGGAVLLLLLEFNAQPLPAVTSVAGMRRDVDAWLAARPEQNVIIEYPLEYTMKPQSLYYTLAHRQKIVHGSSILWDDVAAILPTLNQWPDPAALDLLQEIEVRYILVDVYASDETFDSEMLPRLLAIERLQLVGQFDDSIGPVAKIYLFELLH